MKVGDLVKHKRFSMYYLVTEVDTTAMIGVILPHAGDIGYIHRSWLEAVK